jgi:hypothetical protein
MSDTIGGINTVIQPKNITVDPRYKIQSQDSYIDVRTLNKYDFMQFTYDGTEGYRTGAYLVPFMRESFYEDRMRTAAYKNLFRPVVDAMVEPVFAHKIERVTNSDIAKKFFENVDRAGTTIDNFTNMIMTRARTCGLTFVVVDNFTEINGITKKDVIDTRRYPYCYEKVPSSMYKIDVNESGVPVSITFYDKVIKIDNKDTQTFRKWDNQKSTLYYEKSERGNTIEIELEINVHNLGKIPVVVVNCFIKNKKLDKLPEPPLYTLAMLVYQLYNKETYVQELEKYQTFSLLVAQGVDASKLSVGPTNFINVSDNVSNMPGYISPNPENTKVMVSNCDRLKQEIYEEAGQKGVYAVKEQSSGIAKEWDFRAEESKLIETSTGAVEFEKELIEIFGLYINTSIKYEAKYPEDFSPQYFDQRIEEIVAILKEMPPEALATELWAEIATIIFKQTPDRADEIIREMKSQIKNDLELQQSMKGVNDDEFDNIDNTK